MQHKKKNTEEKAIKSTCKMKKKKIRGVGSIFDATYPFFLHRLGEGPPPSLAGEEKIVVDPTDLQLLRESKKMDLRRLGRPDHSACSPNNRCGYA